MVWETLHKATTVAMLSFVVSSMLAMGTGLTVGEIVAALRNHRLIMVALLANFVLMPILTENREHRRLLAGEGRI